MIWSGDTVHGIVYWSCGRSDDFVVLAHETGEVIAMDEIGQDNFTTFRTPSVLENGLLFSIVALSYLIDVTVYQKIPSLLNQFLQRAVDGSRLLILIPTTLRSIRRLH